jgi:hypothetical protein
MAVAGVLTSAGEAELAAAGASFMLRDYQYLPSELDALLFL